MTRRIAVIGAGPAGIYTSLFLKDVNAEIHLFEKNKNIGEKLKLTGGGRMNVTNKVLTENEYFSSSEREKSHFFKNPLFKKIPTLLSELGIEYTYEKTRAMLTSQNATEEVFRLRDTLAMQENCTVHCNSEIINISAEHFIDEKAFAYARKKFTVVFEDGRRDYFDEVIITTGGMFQKNAQPNKQKTYCLFENFGHFIVKPSPSLSPFRFSENPLKSLSGIAFVGTLTDGKSTITDDMLITHFGLSGPAVLDFSALWNPQNEVSLNFLPEFSAETLRTKINELRNGKNSIVGFFTKSLPKRLVQFLVEKTGITNLYFADISKKEVGSLIECFTSLRLPTPQLFPYPGCWTTKGGVSLREVNMHSLESKKVSGLFIGGEVLDIDGLCGGYHISLAVLQGKIIAEAIGK